ncbi:hypothetical protein scyTo_0021191, partial [Scyliorhinus torazame]|nr:hypothetical protein [Scyliorhinus torazame]
MPFLNFDLTKFVEDIERGNEAISRQRKRGFNHGMRSELKRLKSFESLEPFASWSPEEMASEGFYFTGLKASVQCFCCGGVFHSMGVTKSPRSEHQLFEPDCGFVKTLEVGNIPKYAVRLLPPENIPPNRREQLREERPRLETFKDWPSYVKMEPDLLVGAGFFYTGIKDKVQCFSCDGSLGNWEEDDDPWKEHSKWFPGRRQAGGGDAAREQFQELSITAPVEEHRESEGSAGRETPSGENSWTRTAEGMRGRLRNLYSSSAFCTTSFNECVSIDLRALHAELQLLLKDIKDKAQRRVTLPELLRDLGRVTVLEGEVGSGKSALLRKVANLWASGHCPLLARFRLVLYLSLRSVRPGTGVADAVRGQLLGEGFALSDQSLKEVVYGLRNRVLILLDEYGEVDSWTPQFIGEELIRKNHLTDAAVVLGLQTNRTASVRQYANAVISIAEFPLYSSIHILKTLFSHDAPRLRKLIYNLGWSGTLRGILKTPLFTLAVCQLWVQYPQEDSLNCLVIFKAFLAYSLWKDGQGDRAQSAVASCGQLALTGVFESRFEFADGDLARAGVDVEDALRLGLLSKFTAQRLKPVYRFFHVSFQEYLAGRRLGELMESEGAAVPQGGLDYLRCVDTFLQAFTRYYYFLIYAAGSSTRAASHIVSHLLGMTQRPSSFDSQADPSLYLEQHPDLELTRDLFIQISHVVDPEEMVAMVTDQVLEFALRSMGNGQTRAAMVPVILNFLAGKCLQLQASNIRQGNMFQFVKLHPEILSVLSHLQITISGRKRIGMTSYSKMAECMSSFGVPKVEEDYVSAFQSLREQMDKTEAQEKEIDNFSSMMGRSIPDSFVEPFVALPDYYKAPKLKLNIHSIGPLQEGESKHLQTLCSLSNCIELTLWNSRGALREMEPAIELYRDRFKAVILQGTELSQEEQDLVISMSKLESLELLIAGDLFPARFLRSFPALRIFRLKCGRVPEFEELARALTACSRLEELVLGEFHLSPSETRALAASLGQLQNLKILDIPEHGFSQPEESETFADVLGSLVRLEVLRLCKGVAPSFSQRLQNLQQLRVLDINKTMDDRSLLKLAQVAKRGHLPRLQTLNLSLNEELSDLGWRDFFLTLDNMSELRVLHISRIYTNQLKPQPDTFKAFVQCVSRLPALVTIHMLSWMLDAMDFNMFNAMKEKHPQSGRM